VMAWRRRAPDRVVKAGMETLFAALRHHRPGSDFRPVPARPAGRRDREGKVVALPVDGDAGGERDGPAGAA